MKKIICALLTSAFVMAATPAHASNDDAAWFLGGVVGGFVLNNLTRPVGRPVYGYQEPIPYYEPQPVYHRVCNRITVSKWDKRLQRRVFWYEKQCRIVPVY